MPRSAGTFEATAVTGRQKFGSTLATLALLVTWLAAVGGWAYLAGKSGGASGLDLVTETDFFLGSWGYVYIPLDTGAHVVGYAHPPIAFWVGLVLWAFLAGAPVGAARAVAAARGKSTDRSRRTKKAVRAESQHVTRQLHDRGAGGMFSRRPYLWLGIGLLGAVLVLGIALFGGTPPDVESGLAMDDPQRGLIVWVGLVGSVLGIVGLLLAFPYGPRERIVVDAAGNVRGADEPVRTP